MTPQEMESRIVRHGELQPCKTAFIDAHTPGSNQKENFTIIGGGVSESPDQRPYSILHGFNIGAAGQLPKCRNSLHSHAPPKSSSCSRAAGAFLGRNGDAGEVLEEGDIFNIPTGIFRGFENIGMDYGMIMAILGGDDAGGGVIYPAGDRGRARPPILSGGASSMTARADPARGRTADAAAERRRAKAYPEPSTAEVVPNYVARILIWWRLPTATSKGDRRRRQAARQAGFRGRFPDPAARRSQHDNPAVLMPVRGHWKIAGMAERRRSRQATR